MQCHKTKRQSSLGMGLDVVFIMVLCFGTLLTTMLMRGKVLVGSGGGGGMDFTFNLPAFLGTLSGLLLYLGYLLTRSDRQLREVCKSNYGCEGEALKPAMD